MEQGRSGRRVRALTALAVALSFATGSIAAERKAEPRRPAAARAASASGQDRGGQDRGGRDAAGLRAAQKPGSRAERAAPRPAPGRPPVAAGAPAKPKPARKEPLPRKGLSKGSDAAGAPSATARPGPVAPGVREAGAQGTVIVRGTCTRLVVGAEKYPCKGAIYALHPDGRVSVQFATHRSTIMLAGGGERETEALEFGLTVDQVKVAASDRPTRQYPAKGRCTVTMKDSTGEVVRTISCDARGGIAVDVDFRSDGEKVDAYYLLTNAGSARKAPRD